APAPVPDEPFVGRRAELAELAAALDHAVAGSGRLVLVLGEPGIGKSRLIEALADHARTRGACVAVGRSWEAGGAPPCWPWVRALRAAVADTPPAPLRDELGAPALELAQLVPELRDVHAPVVEQPPLDPDAARFRLFEAVAACLRRRGRERPLVL